MVTKSKSKLTGDKEMPQNDTSGKAARSVRNTLSNVPRQYKRLYTKELRKRLSNSVGFLIAAEQNQWSTRVDRGWRWYADVVDFVIAVYGEWLGKGLLRSDLKAVDPKLYAQLHKHLSMLSDDKRSADVARLNLPIERSDEALAHLIKDPAQRMEAMIVRRYERERRADRRARAKERQAQNPRPPRPE